MLCYGVHLLKGELCFITEPAVNAIGAYFEQIGQFFGQGNIWGNAFL